MAWRAVFFMSNKVSAAFLGVKRPRASALPVRMTDLVDQSFVQNPEETIAKHVETVGGTLGDQISVLRFVRFQVGEALAV